MPLRKTQEQKTSDKLETVFRFIVKWKTEHNGNSPSLRDIGRALAIRSVSQVKFFLMSLESAGRIDLGNGTARTIVVKNSQWVYFGDKCNAAKSEK